MPNLKGIFQGKQKFVTVKAGTVREEAPEGLWTKCGQCGGILYKKELTSNLGLCGDCGFHFRLSARERMAITLDEDSFVEYDEELLTVDPLGFPGYDIKVEAAKQATGLDEAIITGKGSIDGYPVLAGFMDFSFVGASMGSVVGEKVTRLFERAARQRVPVIVFCASGGARMQEGMFSLMQMAKTAAACAKLSGTRTLYISVLTNPTTAGVFASFGSLGDIIIAEPGALVGFTGQRVIEETIRQKLPPGFQTSEFALEHGLIDMIVDRRNMRKTLGSLLSLHGGRREDAG
ncbi:MAG TPA: acetyl-CoA carboxylase carboxyltransferase subunit beta [Firmicutes bacterium]|jgi:acetyl-CoA carboxylase carboxyl transferase subunit beta|nr:acetyl-CoA carboxylase carboxyltransferase subunit beta [Bacillota bacterium]